MALLSHDHTRLRRSSSALARGGAPRFHVERRWRGDHRLRGRNPACDEPASLLACSWPSPPRSGSGAPSPAESLLAESRWA